MKRYQFEEITFGLSTIICLLAYGLDVRWLFWIFLVKSIFDFFCAIKYAAKSYLKTRPLHPDQPAGH